MTEPLNYASPTQQARGPWYTRVPLTVLFLLAFVPWVIFTPGGKSMSLPGIKWEWHDLLLPPAGCPLAIAMALYSLPCSSPARRVGLWLVAAHAALLAVERVYASIGHW